MFFFAARQGGTDTALGSGWLVPGWLPEVRLARRSLWIVGVLVVLGGVELVLAGWLTVGVGSGKFVRLPPGGSEGLAGCVSVL